MSSYVKSPKKAGIILRISDLNRYNFLPSYSFMELIAYINAQYCSVYFRIFPYIYCLDYMYYAISVPLIKTQCINEMTFCVWVVNRLTFTTN